MENRAIQNYSNPEVELPGARVVELLNKTFNTLDPNNDGSSRAEIAKAMIHPEKFSVEQRGRSALSRNLLSLSDSNYKELGRTSFGP